MDPEKLEELTTQELLELIALFPPDWDLCLDWFMYKFSVFSSLNNWAILQQAAEELKDLDFIQVTLPELYEKIEPRFFLECLNIFCCLGLYLQ